MKKNQHRLYIVCEAARAILWSPISNFFFETVQRNKFNYFYWNDLQIFGTLIGGFRTIIHCVHRRYPKISIFYEFLLLCCLCKNISHNFTRLAMFYLKHLYSKTLDVSMMNRDCPIFFQKFCIRWQFVILNESQKSFISNVNA